jgi:2-phospho-L-lactate/phosphoenolpyruvate guanylyltransferase
MSTVAVLPVKRFLGAKRRLSPALERERRGVLAEAMLRDVLLALSQAARVDGVVVVTREPRAAYPASFFGADVVHDEGERGHSEAAALGVARAIEAGAARALLVPGDCPALDPLELDGLLDGRPGPGVVVVPDRHGTGTNALVLSPPGVIKPAFGPGSCARHAALARAAGVPVAVERVGSLAYDADTTEDLAALRQELDRRGRQTATQAALRAFERGERFAFAGG